MDTEIIDLITGDAIQSNDDRDIQETETVGENNLSDQNQQDIEIEDTDLIEGNSDSSQKNQNDDFFVEDEYLIDQLRAIVMTTEGTEVVVQSDLERPAITGQMMSLQERIDECAFYLDAVKQKAVATEDQIDRYFAAIQHDNNITLDDLKRTFEMHGLTYTQAREQLGRMQTVNTILELRVMSNVIVPRKDILAHYQDHTFVHDAIYYLQRAVIPFNTDYETQRDHLLQTIQNGESPQDTKWSMIFTLEANEIAQDKAFIKDAAIGQVLFADAGSDGFELYRVVDMLPEQPIPIDECYAQIERILRQPLYEKLLSTYKEKLYERTTVIYI